MKLSCSRCRSRKLKCDRQSPSCERCQNSGERCIYPERKKSTRTLRKAQLHRFGRRLEFLEERMASHLKPIDASGAPDFKNVTPAQSEGISGETERPTKAWIYSMVSGARNSVENENQKGQLSLGLSNSRTQETISNAMKCLDTTLDQLAVSNPIPEKHLVHDKMSPSDATHYIEVFLRILSSLTHVMPFQTMIDAELLRALPYIIDSSHAQVNPALRMIYYNAIYRGQTCGSADEYKRAAGTYIKCLQSVPSWLSSAQGSQMDLMAASLTSWTAIDNFDYHLAWKFHSEACRFSEILGIQDVETSNSDLAEDDPEKNDKRRLHWHLVMTDCLYRLWYDKPSALKSPISRVKLPVEISPRTKQPEFTGCVLFIVWARMLFILEQFFELSASTEHDPGISFQEEVNSYCNQLEDLLIDWDLLSIARSPRLNDLKSWLFVDTIVAFYSCIIYIRRKTSDRDENIHPQAVRAARNILAITIEWSEQSDSRWLGGLHMQLATFYPFCAFFALYHHILSSRDSGEYEEDLQTLDRVVHHMTKVVSIRSDFVPLAEALSALNDVSRAARSIPNPVHRQSGLPPDTTAERSTYSGFPDVYGRPANGNNQQYQTREWNQQPGKFPNTSAGPLLTNSLYDICSALPSTSDDESIRNLGPPFQFENPFSISLAPPQGADPDLSAPESSTKIAHPLEYVHAMESSLLWRNWHEHWWNSSDKNSD